MSLELNHFIRVYPGILEPELCARLIDLFESNAQQHEAIDQSPRGPKFTQLNLTNLKASIRVAPTHAALEHAFKNALDRYQRDVGVGSTLWPQRFGFEQFRIKRYRAEAGESFPPHVDVADYASARRFLACFFYLNETDGGQTQFLPNTGPSVDPQPGSVMMFPPLWLYPHSGEPVKSGAKYIVGTYLHYL